MQRIAGITASSEKVVIAVLEQDGDDFELVSQDVVKLQAGDRPKAYRVAYDQIKDRLRQAKVECVCIKGSAVSLGGTKMAHLESAEVRGLTIAAAASVCEVRCVSKSAKSRTKSRKVDEYLKDQTFWDDHGLGELKSFMREAAFMAISEHS